jgi:lysozyme
MTARAGLPIIKEFEGCRHNAYLDSTGIPTIGYGHTEGVKMGDVCTQEQADAWLIDNYDQAEDIVKNAVSGYVELNDNQLGALTSFVYNVGAGETGRKDGLVHLVSGGPSHLLIYTRRQDWKNAADQFLSWDRAGGVVLLGLQRRRAAERALFLS